MYELWIMTYELHKGDALQCNMPYSIIPENEKKSREGWGGGVGGVGWCLLENYPLVCLV